MMPERLVPIAAEVKLLQAETIDDRLIIHGLKQLPEERRQAWLDWLRTVYPSWKVSDE